MKFVLSYLLAACAVAAVAQPHRVQLLCHRTANKDAPENTMESLQQAALLGCDVIEIDVRRTLDGVLMLNHDGFTERLTDGEGEVEQSFSGDLEQREAGAWMGDRWRGLHMAHLDEALHFAHSHGVQLILDVKTKGIGPDVLREVDEAGMRSNVLFNGEWADIKQLYPQANGSADATWLQPGVSTEKIAELHRDKKFVIVNFSANAHEVDLSSMKAAVAAGADGINVDYPRLGADAVGRPVEARISSLMQQANGGDRNARLRAITELARYRGIPLETAFSQWLLDPDAYISKAAAVALVTSRPQPTPGIFRTALQSPLPQVQANAAWALGALHGPATMLRPLLHSNDPVVLEQTLLALGHMPGSVPAADLTPLLVHLDPKVRGAAAVALAAHDPEVAQRILPARLRIEIKETLRLYDAWDAKGKPSLSHAEIKAISDKYRCEMKFLQALGTLPGAPATEALEEMAFHPGEDFLQMHSIVAEFKLWDRIGQDPHEAIRQLSSSDAGVAGRAEWLLTMADPSVQPAVRDALKNPLQAIRLRAIHIVAFRGDAAAIPILQRMKDAEAPWAIAKIRALQPLP